MPERVWLELKRQQNQKMLDRRHYLNDLRKPIMKEMLNAGNINVLWNYHLYVLHG